MKEPMTFGAGPMLLTALMGVTTLLSGCVKPGSFGTAEAEAICRELRDGLPSYSPLDTERTLTEGADYLLRFQAVCEGSL